MRDDLHSWDALCLPNRTGETALRSIASSEKQRALAKRSTRRRPNTAKHVRSSLPTMQDAGRAASFGLPPAKRTIGLAPSERRSSSKSHVNEGHGGDAAPRSFLRRIHGAVELARAVTERAIGTNMEDAK